MRSIQRQSLSSRSSVTSPLAFSENGIKPSWSLSAKLHMRSNSPSRFSLDSRSSPPLERIGEACDDKVSTSCFGGYSRHERQTNSKAPLASMEGNSSDDGGGKKILDETYVRAPTVSDKKSSKGEPLDNNNQISAVDQNVHGTPAKEPRHKSSSGSASKAEAAVAKKTSISKSKADQENPAKKRQSTSIHRSPSSQVSSSSQGKGAKVTNSKEKSEHPKTTRTPSGTPTKKKESSQSQEPGTAPGKTKTNQRLTSTPQSSASPSPTVKKGSLVTEKSSTVASSRKKLAERSSSGRDSSHASPMTDRPRAQLRGAEGGRPERKAVRSSSSSSSLTSLRSPSISSRELRRTSKSEDKGLSFFKSALRQKETRRSADLGKSAMLTKKAGERTSRSSSQNKLCTDEGNGEGNSSTASVTSKTVSEDKEISKISTPVRRSLLQGKSKSSSSEMSLQSPVNGKRPLEKMPSSRKLSCSMQSPARATQTPQ